MTKRVLIAAGGFLLASFTACNRKADVAVAVDAAVAPPARPVPSVPANGLPAARANIEAVVNPDHLPPYMGPTGSLEGTVTIRGDHPPDVVEDSKFAKCRLGASTYAKLFREGPEDASGNRPLADAVVAVTGYSGFYVPERDEAKSVSISNCAFPRAISLTIGQRLEVTNDSNEMWAPAIEQANLPALMIVPPKSDPVRLYPPRAGHHLLVDRLSHGYAHSDLWVLAQPLHAISDLNGHFRIDDIPVGQLEVHARVAGVQSIANKPIEILAGVVRTVTLGLTYTKPSASPSAPVDASSPLPEVIR